MPAAASILAVAANPLPSAQFRLSGPLPPAVFKVSPDLAQLSRHEHDRLRDELREAVQGPVNMGSLEAVNLQPGRLNDGEKRLLREQLRQQQGPLDEVRPVADAVVDEDTSTPLGPRSSALRHPRRLPATIVEASASSTRN